MTNRICRLMLTYILAFSATCSVYAAEDIGSRVAQAAPPPIVAAEQKTDAATYLMSGTRQSASPKMLEMLGMKSAVAAQSCNTTCNGTSYKASCTGEQSCDCSCSRTPVCQCR